MDELGTSDVEWVALDEDLTVVHANRALACTRIRVA